MILQYQTRLAPQNAMQFKLYSSFGTKRTAFCPSHWLTSVASIFFLACLLWVSSAQAQTTDINGPAGSGKFGTSVKILPNGNYVVADPFYDEGGITDIGAVYLYNGATHALISTLKGSKANDQVGSNGVTALTNGNYVVSSQYWANGAATFAGAVTWGSGTAGVSGTVSSSNSLVGSRAEDLVGSSGVTALTNGNYVVSSPFWDNGTANDAGAVTWGSSTTGVSGTVSSSNSLVGSTAGDRVGNFGVTALTNGNYVVRSPFWDNGTTTNAGAVTWGSSTTGVSGTISSSNSLVGSRASDGVGSNGVTALTNGNYVVSSSQWANGTATYAGAVTWGSGTTGVSGTISSSNSLVGSTASDQVGNGGVTALTNGNYVVSSLSWANGVATFAGAVTWGSGTTGVRGPVSSSNSLVGSTASDQVGNGGVTALTNGNYVVRSLGWDNGTIANAGAVTWGSGTTGVSGTISSSNSLVGSTASDQVGSTGVTALTNGNYVVISRVWDNGAVIDAGAVTWCSDTTGVSGTISSSNSLVGSTANDQVGSDGVTALTNGNYVVRSPQWDNGAATNAGAVTWGSGTTGLSGTVSSSNSLVGSTANDQVGISGVTALTNGNYVVSSRNWDNGAATNAGAVTWGSGTTGVSGTISSSNSLVGSTASDGVGNNGVLALTNGNYVVRSQNWDNGMIANAGAVTWGSGTTGLSGTVSSSNSLVGSTANDVVGSEAVTALTNGNYVVRSISWDNGAATNAGAVTWGSGTAGVSGSVSSSNSLVGSRASDLVGFGGVTALTNGNYVVRSPRWANGAVIDAGAVTWGNGTTGVSGSINTCNSVVGTISDANPEFVGENTTYNYTIVSNPSQNKVAIFSPTGQSLSIHLDDRTANIVGTGITPFVNTNCRIIATVAATGASPISGSTTAKVWVQTTQPTGYVKRHHEIAPTANAATATGKVTLYFTQAEFDDFNAVSATDLPANSGDDAGKANLRIKKYEGTSNDGSGAENTYTGAATTIDPTDTDIVWNASLSRWEVSFDAVGFGGFFVVANVVQLPTLTVSTTTTPLTAFTACANTTSAEQSFTVSGSNLTADITVTAPTGFEVSKTSGSGFGPSTTLTQSGGTVGISTIYVRMAASSGSPSNGNITCASTGATTQNVAVSGTVNALPTITLGTIAGVSTTATSFSIPFTATTGSPNQYSLVAGTPAISGFSAVSNQPFSGTSGTFNIIISASTANTYNFNLTVRNSSTGCVSSAETVALAVTASCPSSTTLHVNATVSGGTGDGSTWANAYASLSDALAIAHTCTNIKTIKVAAGTYKPTKKPFNAGVEMTTTDGRDVVFHIPDGVTIEGGYNAATGLRTEAPFGGLGATILSGDIDSNDALDAKWQNYYGY